MSDRWPAMMTRETAAEYCDMTPVQFDAQCPVQPIDQGWRGLRWKRNKLDAWIENLPEKPRKPAREGQGPLDALTAPAPDAPPPVTAEDRRRASLARVQGAGRCGGASRRS